MIGIAVSCSPSRQVDSATQTAASPSITAPSEFKHLTIAPSPSSAREADADVLFVSVHFNENRTWNFSVTVSHPDTGWEDYVDGWNVIGPAGSVYFGSSDGPFTRLLLHPHIDEQPFTRSQSQVVIPETVTRVTVQAHDLISGFGGQEIVVDLLKTDGQGFDVIR